MYKTAFKEKLQKATDRVKQYYEFVWDDEAFGLDEHSWLPVISVLIETCFLEKLVAMIGYQKTRRGVPNCRVVKL